MRTPPQIYEEFKIMPNLQLHQLRVAAVGKIIAEHFNEPVNVRDVVLACLFHDMGNIVKFKLDTYPDALEPKGLEYWQRVKEEVIQKYGNEQHVVSQKMACEIGLSETVGRVIAESGFNKIQDILSSESFDAKILEYSDLRVAPYGVVPLPERFADFAKRYETKDGNPEALARGQQLEQQIFARASVKPEDITDATIAPFIEELKGYWVSE